MPALNCGSNYLDISCKDIKFNFECRTGWPGLDIAFLLDAASYHTDRDVVERIKAGTLQARVWVMVRVVVRVKLGV